jgi:hypothetical protein
VHQDKENPPPYSGLDFGTKTDTEKAISEKFNNDGLLPNYSKDSELALNTKIRDLTKITGSPESLETSAKLIGTAPVGKPGVLSPAPAPVISSSMKCKFLSSAKCHPDYPNFSGASIEGSNMKCDNLDGVKPCKAVCTISNGKISGVYIIHPGAGYKIAPKIEIIGGGGEGADLKSVLVEGKVKEVKVMSGGSGFHETPILKIESPNSSNGCYLCCK